MMTTGLLEMLKEINDYKTWLKTCIIRQYGICISMREDSMNLTQDEILKNLKERDANQLKYINEKIQQYKNEIAEAQSLLDTDTTEIALKQYDEMQNKYIKAMSKAELAIQKFEPKRFEYSNLVTSMRNSSNEILSNMADTVEQQFKYSIEDVENKLKYAEWEKPQGTREDYPKYYREQLEKSLKQAKSRLNDAEFDLESHNSLADEYIKFCEAVDALEI